MKIIDIEKGKKVAEKIKTNNLKISENAAKFVQDNSKNLIEKGNNVVNVVIDEAKLLSKKNKEDAILRKIKKYSPIFPDFFNSKEFNIPNMIMIVDDEIRRNIEVCDGSIGWLGKVNDIEVLYLYDEYIQLSNIQFVPFPSCDEIYYIDNFDRNRFIRTDYIFVKSHEEKLAELKHIAFSLGAKRCFIEFSENKSKRTSKNNINDLGVKLKNKFSISENYEQDMKFNGNDSISGKIMINFEGSNTTRKPELKWFKHDDNIKRLIDMRINEDNPIKSETLELYGSTSATMTNKTAIKIDAALSKMGAAKSKYGISSQSVKENNTKLIYKVEF